VLQPRVMLLEEPKRGFSRRWYRSFAALLTIRQELGVALLLVEQNLAFAFAVAGRGHVLERAAISAARPSAELQHHTIIK
jgi:ABC-type branched-subunit amino acid transport system ATPase component